MMERPIRCSKAWHAAACRWQESWSSIREWIKDGSNGLLVDATDAQSLADAILEGLGNKDLRQQAAGLNQKIILERAEYTYCMSAAERFYQRILSSR